MVYLQVEDNTVRFQDLKDRNISVEGILPNAKGRVSILSEKPAFFVEPMQTKFFFQSIADAFRAIRA